MKKVTLFIIFVCFLVLVVGYGAEAAEKTFKIGIMAPQTGPSAKSGTELLNAAKMVLEEVGGRIQDYKLELVVIDTQSDPAKATNAYAEAAERGKVQVTLYDWNSSVSIACMDLAAMYKIPHLAGLGGAEVVSAKYRSDPKFKGYWLKAWATPLLYQKGYIELINDVVKKGIFKPEKKRVSIWAEETDWGREFVQMYTKFFGESGWEIASVDVVGTTQTDFYPVLTKYKQLGVSVVAAASTSLPGISSLIKQMKEVGLKALTVADGLGYTGEWYQMTGTASNYVLDMFPQLATQKGKDWAKTFEKKYGFQPSASAAAMAYDGMHFFLKVAGRALDKYKVLDKESIHKVILEEVSTSKLTYKREEGAITVKEYRYAENWLPDPVVSRDAFYFPIVQFMNGKGSIVFPEDIKETDFQVPK